MRTAEQDTDAVRREVRKLLVSLQNDIASNTEAIAGLTTQVQVVAGQGAYAEISNILPDSHPEWSKAAWDSPGVLPADAGDENLEAYNWFRQDAADDEIIPDAISALKAEKTIEPADHTEWAIHEAINLDIPRWQKVNGVIEMGGVTELVDLIAPLPNDLIFPGQIYYIQFEAMLASGTLPAIQAYCGFYDNTLGQRKYIEGGSFTITDDQGNDPGVSFGIPGSTSVDYKVIAFTDSGEQAESNVLNFPNAPATFTGNNHPRIKFAGVPGFIKFDIYRFKDGQYVLQFTVGNSIDGIYADIGNPPIRVVDAFPTVTIDRPRAYAITSTFAPGSMNGLGWVRHAMTIFVPTTYDRSQTEGGMQYFRFGLSGNTAVARQVLIRRFGVSLGSGKWARSADDIRAGAHSTPSSTATGAGGSGSGGIDPPPGGGGGGACVLLDTTLALQNGGRQLKDVKRGDYTRGLPICGRVLYVKTGHASRIFHIETVSGLSINCTFDHPLITCPTDFTGTPCEVLKKQFDAGEDVFVEAIVNGQQVRERITSITEEHGDFFVGMPIMEGQHVVILGGFLCHNEKNEG